VQNVWRKANQAADQTLVTIVNGGGSRVQIQGGTVSLNLRQIVADLAQRLGLPSDISAKLPASVANRSTLRSVNESPAAINRSVASRSCCVISARRCCRFDCALPDLVTTARR